VVVGELDGDTTMFKTLERLPRRARRAAGIVAVGVGLLLTVRGVADIATAEPSAREMIETIRLARGCNNIALTWKTGTPPRTIAAAVDTVGDLTAVWKFNNAQQRFEGYAPDFPGASDLSSVTRLDAVFLCVTASGSMTRPLMVLVGE
jgi:hypothetical protein